MKQIEQSHIQRIERGKSYQFLSNLVPIECLPQISKISNAIFAELAKTACGKIDVIFNTLGTKIERQLGKFRCWKSFCNIMDKAGKNFERALNSMFYWNTKINSL